MATGRGDKHARHALVHLHPGSDARLHAAAVARSPWHCTPASNPSARQAAVGQRLPAPTCKDTHLHVAVLRGGQGVGKAG